MPKLVFSGLLAEYLRVNGLKPFTAQAQLGATDTTIGSWMRGETLPPTARLPALAPILGMTAADLSALVARERSARQVGGNRKRQMVGSGRHVRPARSQHRRAGAA